ncbi:2-polyprenyl-6-methoxyphenol hydroxylase-like oxidoreductase [Leptolyngbya sp. Heron Island J]|uniref:FAD-dependent oxidoreductase n=1 Tax=Leptolyngbya sp. Heron Island J TaxID=1385935 RepID=UPI0003B97CB5|nr:FAD-dependent oxidoreductase [Leptolyngbya sp. Heron Island J]ESA38076.1 2-polyprenyl-6-methoxyphenol hydroxylase-like oxidoreductase [Leptolyngbya sp. Heron Island J]
MAKRVIIVGAGPAGASLALLLARSGIHVTLLEQETTFERVFRGEGLMPAGMDALHQMGLSELLKTLPHRRLESWNIHLGGQEVFVIPEPDLGERSLNIISQPALLQGMVEEASRHECFEFKTDCQVQDLLWENNRVVGVQIKLGNSTTEIRADLVVGCDGRGSLVRRKAKLAIELQPDQYDVLWFKLPAPQQLQKTCQFYLMAKAQQHPASCYTSWDGQLQYGLILPKGGLGQLGDVDWLSAAAKSAPDWLGAHVLAQRGAVSKPVRLNVVVGHCNQWWRPGVLLLGDAAHPMSPIRAQGINLALRDAIVATNYLVPALQKTLETIDNALPTIQQQRMPEVVRSQTLQIREANSLKVIRSSPWKLAIAQQILPLAGKLPWLQQAWLARQHDLRHGSQPVQLICD